MCWLWNQRRANNNFATVPRNPLLREWKREIIGKIPNNSTHLQFDIIEIVTNVILALLKVQIESNWQEVTLEATLTDSTLEILP